MGGLSFALLALMFVKLMAEADVFQSKENNREESCITWKCGRKRAVQLDQEESKRMNKIQPSEAKQNCISWQCKREMLLRSRFLNSNRAALAAAAKIKQLDAAEGDEAAQARKLQPQMTVDEEPCLTKGCPTAKRSMKERLNAGNTALKEKLKLLLVANSKNAPAGCSSWGCIWPTPVGN